MRLTMRSNRLLAEKMVTFNIRLTMRSKLERYYFQRKKNILQHLHEFESGISEEGLHGFRVELKKLKAVIRFLQAVHGKQEVKKIRKAVAAIFQEAGALRELQLFLVWLGNNRLTHLKKELAKEHALPENREGLQQILKAIRKKLSAILESNQELVDGITQNTIEQYTQQLKHTIEKNLQQIPAEHEWHELRKLIKQWTYAVNWTTKRTSTGLSRLYQHSHQLQEAIGNWHDAIHIHITLLTMKGHLPKDAKVQKDHIAALQKIAATIKQTAGAVQQLLEHPVPGNRQTMHAGHL